MPAAGGKGDATEGDNEIRKTGSRSKEAAQGRARPDEGGKAGHEGPRRRRDPNCNCLERSALSRLFGFAARLAALEYELIIRTNANCARNYYIRKPAELSDHSTSRSPVWACLSSVNDEVDHSICDFIYFVLEWGVTVIGSHYSK